MDLTQNRLSKSEWESIEIPISSGEIEIINIIMKGFSDVNIKYNKNNSIFTFLKIDYSVSMEDHIYNKYFQDIVKAMIKKYNVSYLNITVSSNPKIKKADLIRITKNSENLVNKNMIYEYVLLGYVEKILYYKSKNSSKLDIPYYTLFKLLKNNIININRHILNLSNKVLEELVNDISIKRIVNNSIECVEKNSDILKYNDISLYEHQKEIMSISKLSSAKLILYIAPTGTGKTLTPLGLSEKHKIIFVCAARHVGLALARSAISVNKKVAFAFGCSSADDIRLHYFAAKEYTKNRKTGGIWKVDNSAGEKVEIIICDIKSYLYAMYYMLSFNNKDDIIMYWDEPTITLDYDNHELHKIINKNWCENLIPNIVLSSATLPKIHELTETISDFKIKFQDENPEVYNIVSHECRKSIPIVNNNGFVVLPHYLSSNYSEIQDIVEHCENYLTLLRYFDLNEVVKFIHFIQDDNYIPSKYKIEEYFTDLNDITMINIKLYYLILLKNINPDCWTHVHNSIHANRIIKINSNTSVDNKGIKIKKMHSVGPGVTIQNKNGAPLERLMSQQIERTPPPQFETPKSNGDCGLYVTTKDAHTLTDGPTIFLSNNVETIAKFCIQQSNIPAVVMNEIMEKIEFNNNINIKLEKLERDLQDIEKPTTKDEDGGKIGKCEHKINRTERSENKTELNKVLSQIEILRSMVKIVKLNDLFVPNTLDHIQKWSDGIPKINTPFTCNIEEHILSRIMLLTGVEDSWKILLLMGIGVFTNHSNIEYTEIMKNLADQQKLYLIIASSDYIYGTNYQFCHAYISKDLNLTQEKIIQAMGRIGRNNIQQDYTVRFRDDRQIAKLFTNDTAKPEVINMNKLFVTNPNLF
jgi:hypothetical protein